MHPEILRRRTFAIISHPDAGKTTLTEKFLLYGGAVQEAGSVTARKHQRASTSDWMELERKRGISITSTVLQFEYNNFKINLLDTPGHEDFSEDTYRILTAVDAVIMVIDAAKGIEAQTKKLFAVCRKRHIPIFTFINKLDRPTKEPFELLEELEQVLGINVYPINWPLGTGSDFKGVYDRTKKEVHLFERTTGGVFKAPVSVSTLTDPILSERLTPEIHTKVQEDIQLLDEVGESLDLEKVYTGLLTPVFFGSAMNNFGVELLLNGFLSYSLPPQAKESKTGSIAPEHPAFSGFVFKIQANMDPKHRDCISFVRVCSGKFTRNMPVTNMRTGKKIRLSSVHTVFGKDRESVDEAFPGDIIGIIATNQFGIGDTITEDTSIVFDAIPSFAPEHIITLQNPDTSNYKRFRDGLSQLLEEGVVQSFELLYPNHHMTVYGAVGPLQFEVVQYRLQSEYGADSNKEQTQWNILRWVSPEITEEQLRALLPMNSAIAQDIHKRLVLLFPSEWSMQNFMSKDHGITISDTPFTA